MCTTDIQCLPSSAYCVPTGIHRICGWSDMPSNSRAAGMGSMCVARDDVCCRQYVVLDSPAILLYVGCGCEGGCCVRVSRVGIWEWARFTGLCGDLTFGIWWKLICVEVLWGLNMAWHIYELAFVDISLVGKRQTCRVVNASGFSGV